MEATCCPGAEHLPLALPGTGMPLGYGAEFLLPQVHVDSLLSK